MNQVFENSSSDRSFSEVRLLLREHSHRINNELASAIGIISTAAARSPNEQARAALAVVKNQLESYAQVHHALQMPEHSTTIDAGAYLRRLCRAITRSKLDANGIKCQLVEQSCHLDSERCWRLGLIVYELIMNAARHAFHCGGGTIRVELLRLGAFVECRVLDDGISEPSAAPGHGLKIIEALAKSLGGTFDQQFGSQGATSVLIIPARC
jgi:two-component sensor histidine kinase